MITRFKIQYAKIPRNQKRHSGEQISNCINICRLISFILLFGCSIEGWSLDNWKIAKESDGIAISYRWHHFGEDRFREMMVEFYATALPQTFLPYLKESENYKRWAPGVAQCECRDGGDHWIMYTRMQTIWPFGQQDMVANFNLESSKDDLIISLKSAPNAHQQIKDVNRLHPFYGSWEIKKDGAGKTFVVYKMLSQTKAKVPRYLQDPIVQYAIVQGMKRLRNCVEADFIRSRERV